MPDAAPTTRPNAGTATEHDALRDLGVRATPTGGEIRVYSASASSIVLCLLSDTDSEWVSESIQLTKDADNVWVGHSPNLVPGAHYSLRADGPDSPTNSFDPTLHLIDPYARGLTRTAAGEWRSYVQDNDFDWAGVSKPNIPLDHTVIYEAHARGISKL
ncbi:MAG: glycogen debranching enzyme, partial [Lacisediminihabitans sp.]